MRPSLRGNNIEAWRARMAVYEMRKQAVLSQLLQLQWYILPVLAIPLAILLGARRTYGPIIVSSIVVLLAIALQTLRSASNISINDSSPADLPDYLVEQAVSILFLTAWILALASASQARRWRWFAVLILAGYFSYTMASLNGLLLSDACTFNLSTNSDFAACAQPNPALLLLLAAGRAIGSAVALTYALRMSARRQRQLPEGLVVSSLRDKVRSGEDVVSAD